MAAGLPPVPPACDDGDDGATTASASGRFRHGVDSGDPVKVLGAPCAPAGGGGGLYLSNDQWDGYAPARDRVLAAIAQTGNGVIMTGDAHEAYAFDVHDDPNNALIYKPRAGEDFKAVEFVVTSASTRGD